MKPYYIIQIGKGYVKDPFLPRRQKVRKQKMMMSQANRNTPGDK